MAGTANVFVHDYIKHYACQKRILFDDYPQFCSDLPDVLYKSSDVRKVATSAYHPHDCGGTERINRTITQTLSAVSNDRENDWCLPLSHHTVSKKPAQETLN